MDSQGNELRCPVCSASLGTEATLVCPECSAIIKQCPEPSCASWNRAESRFCRSCRAPLPSATEVASAIGIGGDAAGQQFAPTSIRGSFHRINAGLVPRGAEVEHTWMAGGRVCWHLKGRPDFHACNPYVVGPQHLDPIPVHPHWTEGIEHPPLMLGHYVVFAAANRIAFWETANLGRLKDHTHVSAELIDLEGARLVRSPVRIGEDAITLLLEQGEHLLLRFIKASKANGSAMSLSTREVRLDALRKRSGTPLLSHPLDPSPHQFFVTADGRMIRVEFQAPKESNGEWKIQVEEAGELEGEGRVEMAPDLYSYDHSLFVRAYTSGTGGPEVPMAYHLRHWPKQARWQIHRLLGTEDLTQIHPLHVRGVPFIAVLKSEKVQLHNAREPNTSVSKEWGGLQLQGRVMSASGAMLVIRQRSTAGGGPRGAFRTVQILDAAGQIRSDQSNLIPDLVAGALFDGVGIGGLVQEDSRLSIVWTKLLT